MRVIAIDGPAGAGKGTIARAVAHALGWRYVDTGAMYRAVALAVLERGVAPSDARALGSLAGGIPLQTDNDSVALDGVDVTDRIRDPDVTAVVSEVAAVPAVRNAMLARQRAAIEGGEVVIEGRDIGTVVAPEADLKIFLTASITERARRRAKQLGLPEDEATLTKLEASIAARDEADAAREASPFIRADDAIVVDSTDKSIEEVVKEVIAAVHGARHAGD